MAVRIRKQHQDEVRARIQVGQLIKVLEKQALDESAPDISPSRLKAIELLLRKSLPDLSSIEVEGELAHTVQRIERVIVERKDAQT